MKIRVETPLKPTEDPDKVIRALKNILNVDYQTYKEGDEERLVGEAEGIDSLRQIYEKLREQYIVEAARGVLKRNIRENELTFYLNKQAAYVGKLHFCAPERESPMGAIKVTIISNKINELVEWLCPPTIDGKPQETAPPSDA
ncbi:MAG: RNA-binding domain-containing protein [Candidatus Jordarchaeales archaeon]